MKKFFSLLLLSTLLVSGCNANNSSSKKKSVSQRTSSAKNEVINYTFNYETDAQPDIGQTPDEAYTKNGVYHVKYVNDYYQITFTDKKSKKTVPLCTKPNCSHKTIECDANLPLDDSELSNGESYVGNGYIQYYKGSLYAPFKYGDYVYLEKISADGSTRSRYMKLCRFLQVKSIQDGAENNSTYYPTITIHRGYVYFTNDEIHGTSATLYRMKLGSDKLEVIKAMKKGHPQIIRIHPYGDSVYFIAGEMSEDGYKYTGNLYRYNTNSNKVSVAGQSVIRNYTVMNGYIYYEDKKGDGIIYRKKSEDGKSERIGTVSYNQEDQTLLMWQYDGDLILSIEDDTSGNIIKQIRIHDNKKIETVNEKKYSPYTKL